MCFNDYRATQPHEGYNIIARWRDATNKKPAARAIRKKLLDDMGKGKGKDPVAMTAELESDEALSLYRQSHNQKRDLFCGQHLERDLRCVLHPSPRIKRVCPLLHV